MNETNLHGGEDAGLNQHAQPTAQADHARPAQMAARAAVETAQAIVGSAQPADAREKAQHPDTSLSPSFEPFDHRYLTALTDEGIDLADFLSNWCRVMRDDLDSLDHLRREGELDLLPRLLHRLSGALGLVGAQSLMEALRRASTSPSERNAAALDALAARTRNLLAQLEAAPAAYRSARS